MDNKFVSTSITLMIGLYASLLGPNLPSFIKNLFNNTIFRILVLFLVLVRANKDPAMAIVIVIAFVLTMDFIYRKDSEEVIETLGAQPPTSPGVPPVPPAQVARLRRPPPS